LITRALHAIEEADRLVLSSQETEISALREIIEVIEMQPEANYMRKYYTEEAWAQKRELREQTAPEILERYHQAWKKLFLEVEAALDVDPAGETGQSLARQWVLLAEVISAGDPGIKAGAIKAWKDHQNWPSAEQDALFACYGLDPSSDREISMRRVERVGKFIGQAIGRKYLETLKVGQRVAIIRNPSTDGSSKPWADLFREVESSLLEDPASEKAQTLAAKWKELKMDRKAGTRETSPSLDDFRKALREKWPPDASVAVMDQVARLYRIEQVSSFLMKALACGRDKDS
jgi:TipAS antibiotic-recognition domain